MFFPRKDNRPDVAAVACDPARQSVTGEEEHTQRDREPARGRTQSSRGIAAEGRCHAATRRARETVKIPQSSVS